MWKILLASWIITGTALAETLHVDPAECSRSGYFCEIQEALDAANDGDTVMLAEARYNLWQESIVIEKSVRLVGTGPAMTVLFGDGKAPGAMVTVEESADSVEISQLSIVGRVMSGSPTMGPGGLDHKGNDLVLDNVHFSKNQGGWGGAVRVPTLFGTVDIRSCIFADNSGFAGGGLAAYDGSAAEIRISESSFSNNNAIFSGGALLTRDIASVALDRVTLDGNTAGNTGGGAHFFTHTGASEVRISGSRIRDNVASNAGGISASGQSVSVAVEDTAFEGNRSSQNVVDNADCAGDGIRIATTDSSGQVVSCGKPAG